MSESRDPILIRHLAPKTFLSFGPDNPGIELKALNLLIGPNGSGKSNLIEAVSLMRAAPNDWQEVTRRGGGITEWIWKGALRKLATVTCELNFFEGAAQLRHSLSFRPAAQTFVIDDEQLDEFARVADSGAPVSYYRYQHGQPVVRRAGKEEHLLPKEAFEPHRSILAQRRDPELYPVMAWLARMYEKVRIYREWSFGRNTIFREPQQADMRRHVLEEDFSNLGLFLNRLKTEFPAAKRAILKALQDLYEGISDFEVNTNGGTVQVFLHEGDFAIPATRLSDGTLRYLCLLAILCDPEPPPLICIEEPELGLHPDILPGLADLLKAASERTQLIVTTHSDILVDAMTETPEAVVVCEKHEGKTEMQRLSSADLAEWLEAYRLGDLWIKGQLGGKRW